MSCCVKVLVRCPARDRAQCMGAVMSDIVITAEQQVSLREALKSRKSEPKGP